MKKVILLSLLGIGLLSSCSKDEVDCAKVWKNYQGEVTHANGNVQKINIITQSYRLKYPSCKF